MCFGNKESLQRWYKYQMWTFRTCGVFKTSVENTKINRLAYELYFIVIFFFTGAYNLCLLIEFIIQPTILDKITKVFFGLATYFGSMVKVVWVKKNSSLFEETISLLDKDIFMPIYPAEDVILHRNITLSKRVQNFYGGVFLLALFYFLLLQKVVHPDELPVAAYTPFGVNFRMMEIYSILLITYFCIIHIAFDSWCSSFLIFAKTQLEFLRHRSEGIGKKTLSDLAIKIDLKKCIHHHGEIVKLVKTIEKSISAPVSIQIFCSISVLCCNFYAMSFISTEDDISTFLTFFIYQMAMLTQIFLLCYFSNEVTLASLKLSHALYSSNWIKWNKANRKLMLLTMLQFQNPIRVRSINRCYCFELTTFTSIVNSSYSYFALLKQMNN